MYAILIEVDPSNTLGGSVIRDLYNTNNHLCRHYGEDIEINIYSNHPLDTTTKKKFMGNPIFHVINGLCKQTTDIIKRMKKNDKLFVMISGHGYQMVDKSGDERDGRDEYIRTIDGILLDDDLNKVFTQRIDIEVIIIVDTCHSGSMFDLDYIWDGSGWIEESFQRNKSFRSGIISLGSCKDNQLSACDVSRGVGYGGILIINMLDNNLLIDFIEGINLKNIYDRISKILSRANQTPVMMRCF